MLEFFREMQIKIQSLMVTIFAIAELLSIVTVIVLFTNWPFRVAFLASQPSLERLANRVVAGVPAGSASGP